MSSEFPSSPPTPSQGSLRSETARGAGEKAGELAQFELGFLLGVLVSEGSFGGDGRQASITVRMHVRHEALFRRLTEIVSGSRLYGPYSHGGREYFQWLVRGPALRRLIPVLDRHLTPEIDGHAFARYRRMRDSYATALRIED